MNKTIVKPKVNDKTPKVNDRMHVQLNVNGVVRAAEVDTDTPLLYVLRDSLGLQGPKYGCGLGQCGACTVLINGEAVRSCVTSVTTVVDAKIVTLEGLGTPQEPHPVQQAFIDEQAAQCGYCINGMVMTSLVFLRKNPHPSEAQIRMALGNNLCRCGTHTRIVKAVQRAAEAVQKPVA
jgi:nicotinate dehydrogenase subunit A